MKTFVRAGALALMLATAAAPAAFAQTARTSADSMFQTTTLNLSAYGEARVAPDKATINLGVVTVKPYGSPRDVVVRVQSREGGENAEQTSVLLVRGA